MRWSRRWRNALSATTARAKLKACYSPTEFVVFLPFLRSSQGLTSQLTRSLHPTRNPAATWKREGEDNNVVIYVPRPPAQGFLKLLSKFVGEPTGRRIELSDEMASYVWELCDGESTVGEICSGVLAKYKLGERQTEVSVLQFLNMLRTRRLIGLPSQEQAAIKQASSKSGQADTAKQTGNSSNHGNSHHKPKRIRTRPARRH